MFELFLARSRQGSARAPRKNVVCGLAALAVVIVSGAAEAKGPGRTYCFYKTCHRVKTIAETQALVGRDMTVMASHYDSCRKDRFNPCGLTSSGEPFFPERADNAASPVLPDGTIVMVWSKATREAVVLRINNAGPYWGNRKLDLSRAAARKLGIGGVGEVRMRVLKAPTPAEARYAKNRRYDRVPGPIGQFASLDEAQSGAAAIMVADASGDTVPNDDSIGTARHGATDDLKVAYNRPVVPGFASPKGAMAEALIAQSKIEQRVVPTAVPASIDVAPAQPASVVISAVTPKLTEARAVAPRRTRVKAVEVRPVPRDPLEAIAFAVADLIDPPAAVKTVRSRDDARKVVKARAKPKAVVVAAKVRKTAKVAVAKATPSDEFRAGHTTYAEDRYRKSKITMAGKKRSVRVAAAKKGNGEPAASSGGAVKQAGVNRGRKSAALRKTGSWQSSAVFDVPSPTPALTGPAPRIPAGEYRNNRDLPRGPLRRLQPSALV